MGIKKIESLAQAQAAIVLTKNANGYNYKYANMKDVKKNLKDAEVEYSAKMLSFKVVAFANGIDSVSPIYQNVASMKPGGGDIPGILYEGIYEIEAYGEKKQIPIHLFCAIGDIKQQGAAMTYGMRYALLNFFCMSEADDTPEEAQLKQMRQPVVKQAPVVKTVATPTPAASKVSTPTTTILKEYITTNPDIFKVFMSNKESVAKINTALIKYGVDTIYELDGEVQNNIISLIKGS